MRPCPNCNAACPDGVPSCPVCGFGFVAPGAPAAPAPPVVDLGRTVVQGSTSPFAGASLPPVPSVPPEGASVPTAKAAPAALFKGTMVGIAPPELLAASRSQASDKSQSAPAGSADPGSAQAGPAQPGSAQPATSQPRGPAAFKGTMIGIAPAGFGGPADAPPAAPGNRPIPKGTMMGLAPPELLEMPSVPPGVPSVPPMLSAPPIPSDPPVRGGLPTGTVALSPGGTVTLPGGTASTALLSPGGTVTLPAGTAGAAAAAAAAAAATGGPAPSAGNAPGGGFKKTVMGVARPGIAPINPGAEKRPEAAAPAHAPAPAPFQYSPAPIESPSLQPPLGEEELRVVPGSGRARRIPFGAAIAISAAAALLTAAFVALLLYRSRGTLEAKVALDGEGREQLELRCEGCADGATVRLGSASARFKAQKAALRLDRPLGIGDNQITLALERQPGKSEEVEITVPVEFRVRGDTEGLTQTPPKVGVRVEALPTSGVVVDGKPLALDAAGKGRIELDVQKDLTGDDPQVKTLERKVSYSITPPGGTPHAGEVSIRLGITPLTLQAPGESIVIEGPTFVLSGRTAKNGVVTVEGRPITVDANGHFAQMMGVSTAGETTIVARATAPDLAPRLVRMKVRRVASLAAEVAALRGRTTSAYSAISDNTDGKRGLAVLLDGSVVEARAESFSTVLLLDVSGGCPSAPCLARVTHGGKLNLEPGNGVTVSGTLLGAVEGPRAGTRVPAVRAEFVLAKGKK
jgi:hypothetical protein